MLILLLILSLVRFNPQGAPIDTSTLSQCHCDHADIYLRDNPTNSHFGTRGRNDIIVSCLATIFACTWTTIHPNVPAPNESGWNSLKRRVVTMIYALLAPEAITAWAMRQYFSARRNAYQWNSHFKREIKRPLRKRTLIEKIKDYAHDWIQGSPLSEGLEEGEMRPWTITHGFFLQMGGFMRCEKGKPVEVYRWYGGLKRDIIEKKIDAPMTVESEIQDRSKGDVLSKTIVILQTMWFITQCIARWSAHLPVTELEVVTLGFAMLNTLTYAFWWNKPQSVGVPVYLETKKRSEEEVTPANEEMGQVEGSMEQSMRAPDTPPTPAVVATREDVGEERKTHWRRLWDAVKACWCSLRNTRTAGVPREEVPIKHRSFLIRQLHEDKKHPWRQLLWRVPYALVLAVLRPLAKLLDFAWTNPEKWDLRVPMFDSYGDQKDDETIYIASSIIASLFGLVHLIPAWFLNFPSRPEMLLWCISAGIITGQPIVLGVWSKWTNGHIWASEYKSNPFGIAVLSGVPLYIIARFILIILAFLSFRHLSPDALVSIDWISFVPHL